MNKMSFFSFPPYLHVHGGRPLPLRGVVVVRMVVHHWVEGALAATRTGNDNAVPGEKKERER